MTHVVQWRAYIGPKWAADTSPFHWDWSVLNDGATYTPAAATTLSGGMTGASTTVPCTDSSAYPAAGGVWVGPNGAGESWEYVLYSGNAANVLGGTARSRQTADNYVDGTGTDAEQSGTHSAGAAVRFWWPLDTNDGGLRIHPTMTADLCATTWYASLQGVTIPQAALRNGHLVLVQRRVATTGNWGGWINTLVGWLESPRVRDDSQLGREWGARVVSVAGVLDTLPAQGVRVGEMQIGGRASAQASGTLARAYKEQGRGEFTGADPTLSPQSVVDGSSETLWISERFIGADASSAWPGDGFTSSVRISQLYISPHVGLGKGHRWIELEFNATVTQANMMIVAHDGYILAAQFGPTWSYAAGDRLIIAENPTVFGEDNPDHDAAGVLDAGLVPLFDGQHHGRWTFTLTGSPTGGSARVQWQAGGVTPNSDPIAYNATAAQVLTALNVITNRPEWQVHGPAGGPWIVDQIDVYAWDTWSGVGSFTLFDNSLTGGTTPSLDIDNDSPADYFDTGTKSELFFDHLLPAGGSLTILTGAGPDGFSALAWGDSAVYFPKVSDLWTASNLAIPAAGQTMRLNADAWETGRVDTPGYNSNGTEWVMVGLPGMGLELTSAMDDSSTAAIGISDVAGGSTDGLPASGDIQVGTEQIAFTGKTATTLTGITRGANSTTAAAHVAGDPVFFVVSGVAVDALPVTSITLVRPSGQPALYNFIVRGATTETVRDPDTSNYTADWSTLVTVAAKVGTNYTAATGVLDLSATKPRLRWVLVEITAMETGTQPLRAMVNEVQVRFDETVFDSSSILATGTIAQVMAKILDNAGVPSGAYSGTTTGNVVDYTTASDMAWPVLADLAEFANARINVGRDSKIVMSNNTFWTGTAPTEADELTRADITYYEFNWRSGRRVGQIELAWRSPDGQTTGTAFYPPTVDAAGRTVRAGPNVYADQAAAETGAKLRFFQARRPYDVIAEVPDAGWGYWAGDVYGFAVQVDAEMEAMDRTYRIVAADHEIRDFIWTTVLRGVQIGRMNER